MKFPLPEMSFLLTSHHQDKYISRPCSVFTKKTVLKCGAQRLLSWCSGFPQPVHQMTTLKTSFLCLNPRPHDGNLAHLFDYIFQKCRALCTQTHTHTHTHTPFSYTFQECMALTYIYNQKTKLKYLYSSLCL